MSYLVWQARPADLGTVMQLLNARVTWLREQGSEQWSTYRRWRPEMAEAISRGETFLLYDADSLQAIGTITMTEEADTDFWSEEERKVPSLYLAKLATVPERAGEGLGRILLEYALYRAVAKQLDEVRMDVWRTSTRLHEYYVDQGWTLLRTVVRPGRFSGTLFSRKVVAPKVNMPPSGVEERPPGKAMPRFEQLDSLQDPTGRTFFDG